MKPVRVLGIGSPFGDDQVGWLTVVALKDAAAACGMPLDGRTLDRPGVALLHALADCEQAIVVDAVVSGAEPGRIHRLDLRWLRAAPDALACTHGYGVAHALELGAVLGRLPPQLRLYGIEIDPRVCDPAPSPEVAEAAARLAAEILKTVRAGHASPTRGRT